MAIENQLIAEIEAGLMTAQKVAQAFRDFEFRLKLLLVKIDRLERAVESYEREDCRW